MAGYQRLCGMEDREEATGSSSEEIRKFWASLWRLNILSKVKTFVSRAFTNSLPTMENLMKRRVVQSFLCSSCIGKIETAFHALWGCENF